MFQVSILGQVPFLLSNYFIYKKLVLVFKFKFSYANFDRNFARADDFKFQATVGLQERKLSKLRQFFQEKNPK